MRSHFLLLAIRFPSSVSGQRSRANFVCSLSGLLPLGLGRLLFFSWSSSVSCLVSSSNLPLTRKRALVGPSSLKPLNIHMVVPLNYRILFRGCHCDLVTKWSGFSLLVKHQIRKRPAGMNAIISMRQNSAITNMQPTHNTTLRKSSFIFCIQNPLYKVQLPAYYLFWWEKSTYARMKACHFLLK